MTRSPRFARVLSRQGDTVFVSFTEQAREILEAAESAAAKGLACADWTVLVTQDGAIRMIADSDWPLDSLAIEQGARAAYRVSESRGNLKVEARSGLRTCTLQSTAQNRVARLLLGR